MRHPVYIDNSKCELNTGIEQVSVRCRPAVVRSAVGMQTDNGPTKNRCEKLWLAAANSEPLSGRHLYVCREYYLHSKACKVVCFAAVTVLFGEVCYFVLNGPSPDSFLCDKGTPLPYPAPLRFDPSPPVYFLPLDLVLLEYSLALRCRRRTGRMVGDLRPKIFEIWLWNGTI